MWKKGLSDTVQYCLLLAAVKNSLFQWKIRSLLCRCAIKQGKKITAVWNIAKYSHSLETNNTRFNKREGTCFTCKQRRSGDKRTHAAFIRFHDMKVDSMCLVFKKSALSTGASLPSDSFPLSQWKSCCSFQMALNLTTVHRAHSHTLGL